MHLCIKSSQWSSTNVVMIQGRPAAVACNAQLNVGVNILLFKEFRGQLKQPGRRFYDH